MSDKPLKPRHQKFVEHWLRTAGANATASAIHAGFSARSARKQAWSLLKTPRVMEAIARAQKLAEQKTQFGFEKAMKKLDEYIDEARAEKQYTAVAKLNSDKLKMSGLLKERVDHRHEVGFQIHIEGIDPPRPVIEATQIGNLAIEGIDAPSAAADIEGEDEIDELV
jgi:hypothetical protein